MQYNKKETRWAYVSLVASLESISIMVGEQITVEQLTELRIVMKYLGMIMYIGITSATSRPTPAYIYYYCSTHRPTPACI